MLPWNACRWPGFRSSMGRRKSLGAFGDSMCAIPSASSSISSPTSLNSANICRRVKPLARKAQLNSCALIANEYRVGATQRLLMETSRIEKKIVLKATRERAWQAISDSAQFGTWFGVEFAGPFVAGSWMSGRIVSTNVDPEVAKLQEPHRGKAFKIFVERIERMERFSFRWHPYAIDPSIDYSKEPMTLVTFELAKADDGILLTITESGFQQIPAARRRQAFEANDGGWTHQAKLVEKYLALPRMP